MIYWRRYIMSYLKTPGVYGIVPYDLEDIAIFVCRFLDHANMRKPIDLIAKSLKRELDSMVSDGFLIINVVRIKPVGKKNEVYASRYELKDEHKDG